MTTKRNTCNNIKNYITTKIIIILTFQLLPTAGRYTTANNPIIRRVAIQNNKGFQYQVIILQVMWGRRFLRVRHDDDDNPITDDGCHTLQ